ncbi:Brp/Blh family beta-carotene 15,15'-dioxygenase [Tenacibaculum sp. C7A-26P2]|uniref:Brp/Blh family beta-carotene 15,15'-dioxygenase n=1 Tax=Tenacibaculum sp. C7A-26P2 TaxID=3447504 RepID=UPI003F870914
MTQNQHFKIFVSLFLFWFMTLVPEQIINFFCYFFILTLGIIHGSNDLQIIDSFEKESDLKKNGIKSYVSIIIIAILFFIFLKKITFYVFIFLSSYHFGEQHFNHKNFEGKYIKNMLQILHGIFLFSILFLNQKNEVTTISESLFSIIVSSNFITVLSILSGLCYAMILIYNWFLYNDYKTLLEEILNFTFFYILFKATSLIVSFSIYFIIWHSIPSIFDQIEFLYKKKSKSLVILYLKKSSLLWLISLFLVTLSFIYLKESILFNSFIFAILFIISIPHIFIINIMNSYFKNRSRKS